MKRARALALPAGFCALAACALGGSAARPAPVDDTLARIQHIVVIYGENRSFDNLYGLFPGADGIEQASADARTQRDRDGSVLPVLPPVWNANGPDFDPRFGTKLSNGPFRIDGEPARVPLSVPTRDLLHRYYQNIEQIDGGRNDRFAAVSDAGALAMGYYDGSSMALWQLAREFTLADHFFMGTFGGSFMNHVWLACGCVAQYPNAPDALTSRLDAQGRLLRKAASPPSALAGPVQWERDGAITPDGYAINTTQPPYQPSGIAPAPGGDPQLADPSRKPLPPQEAPTIGDRLTERSISWAWYAGGWNQALTDSSQPGGASRGVIYSNQPGSVNFQPHHQPYNYFRRYAPGTAARREHLKDLSDLLVDIASDRLPQVAFYKPVGDQNQHPGYTDVLSGDRHIADLVRKIQASPAWSSTLIVVTYDENGGFWDHASPPSGAGHGDRWGPGTRVPAILISPFVKKAYVDHTPYDTGSILRLLEHRFALTPLPDARVKLGDLTGALDVPQPRH
ncbi:MAG: acid phosphatase [Betaproteobacteria bacterium]|nr:MAG: acid phosphatase [Betaproteobacteria bacterium]